MEEVQCGFRKRGASFAMSTGATRRLSVTCVSIDNDGRAVHGLMGVLQRSRFFEILGGKLGNGFDVGKASGQDDMVDLTSIGLRDIGEKLLQM